MIKILYEDRKIIEEMYNSQMPINRIADRINVARSTLYRELRRGVEKFYLGVPGVYYDREKMAAEMFGFEAFEGKQTPAEPGSFGYYMKSVRI